MGIYNIFINITCHLVCVVSINIVRGMQWVFIIYLLILPAILYVQSKSI
jgi:hypothetical protein